MTVSIVGGGPVGLLLGCLLAQQDIPCEIFEKRLARSPHSRGIGLHPPALTVLEKVGLAERVVAQGVRISGGWAYYERQALGRLSFATLPGRYPFALAIPQNETECLLEERLGALPAATLHKGVTVHALEELTGTIVVGCDGKDSAVRSWAGIGWQGGAYPDRYLMGDFADDTGFGTDAALFLTRQGIVESFPLPEGQRRWVARLEDGASPATAAHLAACIQARLGRVLPQGSCRWVSAFGVHHYHATRLVQGRVALAGDAAHVVSPIGGQGMTLGFLGAATLAEAIVTGELGNYPGVQQRRAAVVTRRAALNTFLGRPSLLRGLTAPLARAVLALPGVSARLARQFTMQDFLLG